MSPTSISFQDLGVDYSGPGPFRSYELNTHGSSLDELRANASISEIDQDGGELRTYGLDECSTSLEAAVELELGRAMSERMTESARLLT